MAKTLVIIILCGFIPLKHRFHLRVDIKSTVNRKMLILFIVFELQCASFVCARAAESGDVQLLL